MQYWTGSIVALFVGVAGSIIAWYVLRWWHAQQVKRKPELDFNNWQLKLQIELDEYLLAKIHMAAMEQRLDKMLTDLPEHFEPTLFEALTLGARVEATVIQEARSRGLITSDVFQRLKKQTHFKPDEDMPQLEQPVQVMDSPVTELVQSSPDASATPLPTTQWKHGKLVPKPK